MARVLLVAQDKGGVGKSTAVRALAEALPGVSLIEIDSGPRLLEFDAAHEKGKPRQVRFFPMRADWKAIDKSGGRAARAEFDAVIEAIAAAKEPTVVDIGANTSSSLLAQIADLAPDLKGAGTTLGVMVVLTAEPGALTEAPILLGLAKPWAHTRFVLENRMRGEVDPKQLARIADGAVISTLDEQIMDAAAVEIVNDRGLLEIPRLDPENITALHGVAKGARIRRDLARFRLEAMRAVEVAAKWLAE